MGDTQKGLGCLTYFTAADLPPGYYVKEDTPLFKFLPKDCQEQEKKNAEAVKKDGDEADITRYGECANFIMTAKQFEEKIGSWNDSQKKLMDRLIRTWIKHDCE